MESIPGYRHPAERAVCAVAPDTVTRDRWNDQRRKVERVREPVRTTYNPNDVSDLRVRDLTAVWRAALVREDYARARAVPNAAWRLRARAGPVALHDGVPTMAAVSRESAAHARRYAIRAELGERAYAALYGLTEPRKPRARKATPNDRAEAREALKVRAQGPAPVLLSDREMMAALGIKPIGFLE